MKKRIVTSLKEEKYTSKDPDRLNITMCTTLIYEPSFWEKIFGLKPFSREEIWYSEVGVIWLDSNGEHVGVFDNLTLEELYQSYKAKKQIFGETLAS